MRIIKIIYTAGEENNLYWKAIKQELYNHIKFKTGNICAENQVIIITLTLVFWKGFSKNSDTASFPFLSTAQVLLTL